MKCVSRSALAIGAAFLVWFGLPIQAFGAGEVIDVGRARTADTTETFSLFGSEQGTIATTAYATDHSLDVTVSTSGSPSLTARFTFLEGPATLYTTWTVLDAASWTELTSGSVVVSSGVADVSLPTTGAAVRVRLQVDGTLDWSSLSGPTELEYRTVDASAGTLALVTGIRVEPREPSVPVILVSTPALDTSIVVSALLTFSATAEDLIDGDLPSQNIAFHSDLQGLLGLGTFETTTLAVGIHEIVASIENSAEATGFQFLQVEVVAPVPVVSISEPEAELTTTYPAELTLQGSASDELGTSYSAGMLRWISPIDGELGTGSSVVVTPSVGSHLISLIATNTYGGEGSAETVIEVLPPVPAVSVTTPPAGFLFSVGGQVPLTAAVTMPDDSEVAEEDVVWATFRVGELATGTTTSTTALPPGRHAVMVVAQSSYATTGSATVNGVVIPGQAGAIVVSPPNGEVVVKGYPLELEGLGSDPVLGVYPEATASWRSDISGTIVTGTSVYETSALTLGLHTLTYDIVDFGSTLQSASVLVSVVARPPILELLSPLDGAAYTESTTVMLVATGYDELEGPLPSEALVWYSNGTPIASGAVASVTTLTTGWVTISVEAIGPGGGLGEATADVFVTTGPVTFLLSMAGQVRSTAGVPLNGYTIEVTEGSTERTVSMTTPTPVGAGMYEVLFLPAPVAGDPSDPTTYGFRVLLEGDEQTSVPSSIVLTAGDFEMGIVVQDILVE